MRAASGPLCDRFGGAIFTFIGGAGMAVGTLVTVFFLTPTDVSEFNGFLTGMIIIFFFSGLANVGTFKQMPMIFPSARLARPTRVDAPLPRSEAPTPPAGASGFFLPTRSY